MNVSNQPFAQLQRDVAGESVADDDIDIAFENVAALNVADEIDRRRLAAI